MSTISKAALVTGAARGIALGRLQTPQDVASLVSCLACRNRDYMRGQSVVIDGGLVYR